MIGIISYLCMPLLKAYTPYSEHVRFFWYFSAITPCLLLVFSWFIFEENCRIPIWMVVLVGFSLLASLWFQFTEAGLPGSPIWLQMLKALIAAMAIFVVWRGRDNDLVEMRAKLRNIFTLLLALLIFIVFWVEVLTDFNPPLELAVMTGLVIFVFSFTLNYFLIKLNPTARLISLPVPTPAVSDDPLMRELLVKMRSERLYADHDLRVSTLAGLLNIPEYKLRKKINQELGYRNFNQFINNYRIEEAGVKLREDTRIPVLSIALDVGFRSISSFNSAFQAQFGVSPTKYRAEFLSDN
ncbi:AraC family transcriptional regulator [Arenicella xantha]|uniref:AraC-like DNA-binding protein n=1 Tax=Arenicella xantha TaxID=644221 RepID=A0A395JNX4_9GAMM|nr:helix-turn-helix domain-containing protein [Arenicella xantha]RBP53309.1 AraC-like DNA-binding protein [Arenicella xantha]